MLFFTISDSGEEVKAVSLVRDCQRCSEQNIFLPKEKRESEVLAPQTQERGVYMGSFIWHEEKCFLLEFRKPHPTLAHTHARTGTHTRLKSKAHKTPTHKSNV